MRRASVVLLFGLSSLVAAPLSAPGTASASAHEGSHDLWSVQLQRDQFVRATFDQKEADVAVTVFSPDGGRLGDFDFSQFGPEPVEFPVLMSGRYSFQVSVVRTLKKQATYQVSIELVAAASDGDHMRGEAEQLVSSARIQLRRHTAESIALGRFAAEKALKLWEVLADDRMRAYAVMVSGNLKRAAGDNAGALALFSAAGRLASLTDDGRLQGEAASNSALALVSLGDFESATTLFHEAASTCGRIGFDYGLAFVLNNRGLLRLQTGQWALALEDFRGILRTPTATDPQLRGNTLNNIGLTFLSMGDFERATPWLVQAAAIWRALGDRASAARTLTNLGRAQMFAGSLDRAVSSLHQAVMAAQTSGDKQVEAQALNNLGQALVLVGHDAEAEQSFQTSLALHRAAGDRRGSSSALNQLGLLHTNNGQLSEAEGELQESLALRREIGLRDEESLSLYALARLNRRKGDLTTAAANLESATSFAETLRISISAPTYRATYLAQRQQVYELLADVYSSQQRLADALATADRSRARVWLEQMGGQHLPSDLAGRSQTLETRLNYYSDQLVRLGSRPESETAKDTRRHLDNLISEYRDLELQSERSGDQQQGFTAPKPIAAEDVQRLVGSHDLLLYYLLSDERSQLFAVSDRGIQQIWLPGRRALAGLSKTVRDLWPAYRQRQLDAAAQRRLRGALRDLSDALLSPVQNMLSRFDRIFICPDDVLQNISFGALTPPGTSKPLGISKELVTIPSTSVLRELRNKMSGRPLARRSVAVFADPVYDVGDRRVGHPSAEAPPLARLAYSAEEARSIQNLAPHQDAWVASGLDASIETLRKSRLDGFQVVHFAVHAVIDPAAAERSGIVLSFVGKGGVARQGFVTANQLQSVALHSELVVLSGCETATGPRLRGEGVMSLARPLFQAGTRAVLATLWKVDDEASAEFMRAFYTAWFRTQGSAASALRSAQESLWRSPRWHDPAFWGAYVLTGDSR
jgi:CHAT domain-containing protein